MNLPEKQYCLKDYSKYYFCKKIDNQSIWKCRLCGETFKDNYYHYRNNHEGFKEGLHSCSVNVQKEVFKLLDILDQKFSEQSPPNVPIQPPKQQDTIEQETYDENKVKAFCEYIRNHISVLLCKNNMSFKQSSVFVSFLSEVLKVMKSEDLGECITLNKLCENLMKYKERYVSLSVQRIGQQLKEQTFQKVADSNGIAIQLDETTDHSKRSQTIVHGRIETNDPFQEYEDLFLTIFENPSYDLDAHSSLKHLHDSLEFNEMNLLSKVKAITSDSGTNVKKLKEMLKGFFLDMDKIVLESSCFLHNENLLCKAIDTLSCMDVVTALLSYLTSSFKRINHLREELLKVDKDIEGLLKYAITRWLSRSKAIDRLIECMDEVDKLLDTELDPVNDNAMTIEELRKLDPAIADLFIELNVEMCPKKDSVKDEQIDKVDAKDELLDELIDLTDVDNQPASGEFSEDNNSKDPQVNGYSLFGGPIETKKIDNPILIHFIRVLMKNKTFACRLGFVSDVLRYFKSVSQINQKPGMSMTCVFEQLNRINDSLKQMIVELKGERNKMDYFPKLKHALEKAKLNIIPETEKSKYITVIENIINSLPIFFKNVQILKSIYEMIENCEYNDELIDLISEFLLSKTTTEMEKILLNILKIEKHKKKIEEAKRKAEEEKKPKKEKQPSEKTTLKGTGKEENKISRGRKRKPTISKEMKQTKKQMETNDIKPKLKIVDPKKFEIETRIKMNMIKWFKYKEINYEQQTQPSQSSHPFHRYNEFISIYKPPEPLFNTKTKLKQQIKKEMDLLKSTNCLDKKKYVMEHEDQFIILSQILIAIKLMYPTTVKCESGFSIMKYVKTEHRTRLKQQSLDSIMRIKYEKDIEIKKAIFYVMKNKNFYMEELEN